MVFKDVSTCTDIDDLFYFRSEVVDCINKLEKTENILAGSMKNELRRIDKRIDYLEKKHLWDMVETMYQRR